MAEITGETVDNLLRDWFKAWGGLLADPEPGDDPDAAAEADADLDPAKVSATRADLYAVLRERFFHCLADDDIHAVLLYARQRKLDPWSGHVWAARQYDRDLDRDRLFIGVKIDGLRSVAMATGKYAGLDDVVLQTDADGKVERATATVYRREMPGGPRDSYTVTVHMENYYPGPGFWDGREAMMLMKCGRAAALREAFPEDLAGLYEPAELERTFHGGRRAKAAKRAADKAAAGPAEPPPTDRTQFECRLSTEMKVRDGRARADVLQRLRNQFAGLADRDPAKFYERAWRAVTLTPKLFGIQPPDDGEAETATGA